MVVNKYLAEFLGTFVLVFFGSMGIIAVGGAVGAAEIIAIALAFGLALLAGIWAVAHVSGAHFNPAVTSAMVLDRELRSPTQSGTGSVSSPAPALPHWL